jgi:hypothetical protein
MSSHRFLYPLMHRGLVPARLLSAPGFSGKLTQNFMLHDVTLQRAHGEVKVLKAIKTTGTFLDADIPEVGDYNDEKIFTRLFVSYLQTGRKLRYEQLASII